MPLRAVWSRGKENFADAAAIREEVFVREQGFSDEFDAADTDALHLTLYEQERPVATLRLLTGPGDVWHIGRVAVRKDCRGRGLGAELMRRGVRKAACLGAARIELGAQRHAVPFYEKLGFCPSGEPYDEQGCPHQPMGLDLAGSPGKGESTHGI